MSSYDATQAVTDLREEYAQDEADHDRNPTEDGFVQWMARRLHATHDALTRIDDGDDDVFTSLESTVEYVIKHCRALAAAEEEAAAEVARLRRVGTEVERHRQAAYLYSIIQSAEESEGGGPETDVERAYDAGILYAARMVLDNEAGDTDWTTDLHEYADEIRQRTVPGTPLPAGERKVFDAAVEWCDANRGFLLDDPGRRAAAEDLALIAAVAALEAEGSRKGD